MAVASPPGHANQPGTERRALWCVATNWRAVGLRLLGGLHNQLPGLRSWRTSGERRNYRLAELAHRALDALMVEVAEAHLAEQMAHAGIAQLGDLIGHLARGADQRAGA